MSIKDSIRKFRCKYCGQEFTMFERNNGDLIFYPDKFPWACHGELELCSHLRSNHRKIYDQMLLFFPEQHNNGYADYCYERVS